MLNMQQHRAHFAFSAAQNILASPVNNSEYLSLVKNLPAMLQTNGLLATWAFLLAKDKDKDNKPHGRVLKTLVVYLTREETGLAIPGDLNPQQLFTTVLTNHADPISGAKLIKITAEAIRFSGWLKRGAEALCDEGGDQ